MKHWFSRDIGNKQAESHNCPADGLERDFRQNQKNKRHQDRKGRSKNDFIHYYL